MSNVPSERPADSRPSIVDLVFARPPGSGGRRLVVAGGAVLALYLGVFCIMTRFSRSAGPWSAEMAARVHDAIGEERAIDVTPPPPAPPPVAPEPPASARVALSPVARTARVTRPSPAAPAQAGQLAAASSAPADFTGLSFVFGSGTAYAGGSTTSRGTSRTPVSGTVAADGKGNGAGAGPSHARAVALDEAAWSCPWPADADAQQVNEQTVVLRAAVRADGHAERVDVLADPGFGFGTAARSCALATRFDPARDPAGQPVAALSPPIRVHFYR